LPTGRPLDKLGKGAEARAILARWRELLRQTSP
jgi:hypothetical protein